jgi:hypothetical protein
LTDAEISFIAESLMSYKSYLEQKDKEFDQLKMDVSRLRHDFLKTGDRQIFQELQDKKRLYAIEQTKNYYAKITAVTFLIRRFQAIPHGHKLRSTMATSIFLK